MFPIIRIMTIFILGGCAVAPVEVSSQPTIPSQQTSPAMPPPATPIQCAPSDKLYIDPRLAPSRPMMSGDAYVNTLASGYLDESIKKKATELYLSQNQPVKVPYANGYVLIHPQNPCI